MRHRLEGRTPTTDVPVVVGIEPTHGGWLFRAWIAWDAVLWNTPEGIGPSGEEESPGMMVPFCRDYRTVREAVSALRSFMREHLPGTRLRSAECWVSSLSGFRALRDGEPPVQRITEGAA